MFWFPPCFPVNLYPGGTVLSVGEWLGVRVEVWWRLEKLSGRIWHRACRDGVSCWLDWLPAFTYGRRKAAERRHYLRRHGTPL